MGLLTLNDLSGTDQHPVKAWVAALRSGDPDRIARTYAPGALLLATLDPVPKIGERAIRGYFENLLREKPGLACTFQKAWTPRPGVLAGIYTFHWPGGALRARFTFVIGPDGIAHHHSSALP
jgi:hypothetical protein